MLSVTLFVGSNRIDGWKSSAALSVPEPATVTTNVKGFFCGLQPLSQRVGPYPETPRAQTEPAGSTTRFSPMVTTWSIRGSIVKV